MNTLNIALSSSAIVLALVIGYFQLRDYFVDLHVFPIWIETAVGDNNTELILIRLSFVNLSSRGRVVRDIRLIEPLGNASRMVIGRVIDLNLQVVKYSLSNVSRQLPLDETLLGTFDIAPYQCQNKWMAFGCSYPPEEKGKMGVFEFLVVGGGHKTEVIAKTHHQVVWGLPLSVAIDLYPTEK